MQDFFHQQYGETYDIYRKASMDRKRLFKLQGRMGSETFGFRDRQKPSIKYPNQSLTGCTTWFLVMLVNISTTHNDEKKTVIM